MNAPAFWVYDPSRGVVVDELGRTVAVVSHEAADSIKGEARHGELLADAPMMSEALAEGLMLTHRAMALLRDPQQVDGPMLAVLMRQMLHALTPIRIDEAQFSSAATILPAAIAIGTLQ